MNRKDKLFYLRYLIIYDRKIRLHKEQTKIVAGDPSWEPSFWLNDWVVWSGLKKNIGSIKPEDLRNGESPTTFFTKLIENALTKYGKDPETYFDVRKEDIHP